jgi:hypothetical protein
LKNLKLGNGGNPHVYGFEMYQNICPLTQSFFTTPTHHMFIHTIALPPPLQILLLKMSVISSTRKGAFMTIVEIMCDPINPTLFFSCFLQCFNDEAIDNYKNIENMQAPNDGDAPFKKTN